MTIAWLVYAAGALVGLWRVDGGPAAKVAVALLWPVGPIAFVITILILLGASVVAFPLWGALLAAGLAAAWWVLA